MGDRFGDGEALDALCAPFGGDLLARNTPDLFGVVLEERAVQTIPKAIDEEVLERFLRHAALKLCPRVGEADAQRLDAAHRLKRGGVELERVVEEAAPVENPRQPLAHQQHRIVRGGTLRRRREIVRLLLIADAQRRIRVGCRCRHRQNFLPPAHDPVGFGEEPVATQVHAIAVVVDGL